MLLSIIEAIAYSPLSEERKVMLDLPVHVSHTAWCNLKAMTSEACQRQVATLMSHKSLSEFATLPIFYTKKYKIYSISQ